MHTHVHPSHVYGMRVLQALPALGLEAPPASIDELFDSWDRDGGGSIDFKAIPQRARELPASRLPPPSLTFPARLLSPSLAFAGAPEDPQAAARQRPLPKGEGRREAGRALPGGGRQGGEQGDGAGPRGAKGGGRR